jgi:hypothetical protein
MDVIEDSAKVPSFAAISIHNSGSEVMLTMVYIKRRPYILDTDGKTEAPSLEVDSGM